MKMKMLRLYFYHRGQVEATWPGKYLASECLFYYLVIHHIWLAINTDPHLDVMQGCKLLTTADAVTAIKAARDEVKLQMP